MLSLIFFSNRFDFHCPLSYQVDGSVGINSKLYSPKRNRTSPEHNQPLLPSGSLCPVGVRIFSLLTIALHVSGKEEKLLLFWVIKTCRYLTPFQVVIPDSHTERHFLQWKFPWLTKKCWVGKGHISVLQISSKSKTKLCSNERERMSMSIPNRQILKKLLL